MRSYGPDGHLVSLHQRVEERGFKVGDHVVRKADEVYAKITGFQKDMVQLSMETDEGVAGDFTVHCNSFLKKDWKKYQPKKAEERIQNLSLYAPRDHDEFKVLYLKGKIAQALLETSKKNPHPGCFEVVHRPSRAVECRKGFAVGRLVLAPCTPRIAVSTEADGAGLELGALCSNFKGEKVYFYLQSFVAVPRKLEDGSLTQGCVCPCFFVATTEEETEANMCFVTKVGDQSDQPLENVQIRIPVLKNIREIAEGEQLCVHRPKKERRVRDLDAIMPVEKPVQKRRRHKGEEP